MKKLNEQLWAVAKEYARQFGEIIQMEPEHLVGDCPDMCCFGDCYFFTLEEIRQVVRNPWLYKIVGYRLTLAYDLWLLKHCTHIHMVGDDWRQSRGARLERMKARQWGIKEY